MKKLYFLLFTFLITAVSFGQIIITEIADPNNNAAARYIEIFNPTVSAVDLTNWELRRWTNDNADPTLSSAISLTPIGSLSAGAFVVIAAQPTAFQTAYGFAPDIDGGTGGPADSNGDDQMAIFDDGGTIIDIFGVPGEDGSLTCHEFEDGRAERKGSATTSKSTWDEADWNVWADSTVGGCTSHTNGPQDAPGIFDPGSWIGTSTDPTLAFLDGPANGSSITVSPENANGGALIAFTTTNFVVAVPSGGDGFIKWNIKDAGDNIVDSGDIFVTDGTETQVNNLSTGNTYVLFAELVDNAGTPISPAVTYTLTVTIANYVQVANLAALRASTVSDEIFYQVTGEVINTYSRLDRNQKYFQDATGGILIDDEFFEIAMVYNEGDGVTNIKGNLTELNDVLQLVPTETDWAAASSTGNVITPEVVTIATLLTSWENFESELVQINGATFTDAGGTFVTAIGGTGNYDITDATNTMTFRSNFGEADYIGQTIPSGSNNLVVLVSEFFGTAQVTARSLSDFTLSSNDFNLNSFKVYPNPTSLGYVNISSKNGETIKATVFDILGKQVITSTVINNKLDVSNLNVGVYIMRLTQNNATTTKKLVIQ